MAEGEGRGREEGPWGGEGGCRTIPLFVLGEDNGFSNDAPFRETITSEHVEREGVTVGLDCLAWLRAPLFSELRRLHARLWLCV